MDNLSQNPRVGRRSPTRLRELRGARCLLCPAAMRASSCCLALLSVILVGCGARTDPYLASSEDGPERELVCSDQQPAARVPDCARATPSAVPLARLVRGPGSDGSDGVDSFHLATDGESIFYISEGRVFRTPIADEITEALTPPGSADGWVRYADGFVYWEGDDVVQRVPAQGGMVEPLVNIPPTAIWVVAGDAILSSGPANQPSPLYRTSLTSGETTEIIAEDPDQFIRSMRVDGDHVLIAYSDSLVTIPVTGGDVETLVAMSTSGGEPPIADEAYIYFSALTFPTIGLYRARRDGPSTPELFLPGFPVSVALAGDDVFANVVPNLEDGEEETVGELMRAPVGGGDPEHITFTDARRTPSFITNSTAGLVVSDCTIYLIEICTDQPTYEYRLVALPRPVGD